MVFRLILSLMVGTVVCHAYQRTTSELAAAEHYQAFINEYRNKTQRLASSFMIETTLRIKKLASQNLFHRAEAMQASYGSEFERMQDTIDTYFTNFDEEFLINAKKLDEEGAPEKVKIAFITKMKNKIERAFATLLPFYNRKFNLLAKEQKEVMKERGPQRSFDLW